MKAAWFFFIILFVSMKFAIAGSNAPNATEEVVTFESSALWQKALNIFQKNSDWSPGQVAVLSEVLDRKGRPSSTTQLVFNIVLDGQGKAHTELLHAFKDGKDVSAEMKKKLEISEAQDKKAAKKTETYAVSLAENPFNPAKQQNVTVRPTSEKQFLFEKTCRRFDFSFRTEITQKSKKENLTWNGMAWLEEGSGIPLKLEFSFQPLPKHVRSLWTTYLYEMTTNGDWFLKEIKVQGQGGFLFIKKGFRSTTSFSDYRRLPQKGDEK